MSVKRENGAPVHNALIRFLDADNEQCRATTKQDGRARLAIKGDGRIAVSRCHPDLPVLTELVGDRKEIAVRLTSGTLEISGTVVDELGRPAKASVHARVGEPAPWMGKWHWAGRTQPTPDGTFRITGLAPGRYRLQVGADGAPPEVFAEAGETSVRIRLLPVCYVTVRWNDRASGKPIRARRQVWEGDVVRGTAEGLGEDLPLRLRVPPGTTLRLHATAEGYHPTQPTTIEVGRDERERTVSFGLDPAPESLAHLTLIARGADGEALTYLMVMRMRPDGSGSGTSRESENGSYELTLPAGRHKFQIAAHHMRTKDDPYLVAYRAYTLKPGEWRTEHITLKRGGWLRRPHFRARVEPNAKPCESFVVFDKEDFRMLLAPGRYTVSAPGPDGTRLSGEVTIIAGRVHDVTLR